MKNKAINTYKKWFILFLFFGFQIQAQVIGSDSPYILEGPTTNLAEISSYIVHNGSGFVESDDYVTWSVKGGVILNSGATMSNGISNITMGSFQRTITTIEVQWLGDQQQHYIEASISDYYGDSWFIHVDLTMDFSGFTLNTSNTSIASDAPYDILGPIENLTQISKYDISGSISDLEVEWSVKGGVILNRQATISNGISHLNNASSIEVRWIDNEEEHYVDAFLIDYWYEDYWILHADLTMDSTPDFTSTPTVLSDENYIYTINYQEGYTETELLNVPNRDKIESVTYFDGLGRPKQQIAIRGGSQGQDILTHINYDAFGRQDKDYLPYVIETNGGAFRTSALNETNGFYDKTNYDTDFPEMTTLTINPYSEKLFEASPLNRVLQQAAPGASWKLGAGHEIKFDYQTNIASEVKLYTATAIWNTTSGLYNTSLVNGTGTVFYAANQLHKTVTYDENSAAIPTETDGSTVEFKNKQGQVVLKRTYNAGAKHDTYYVYDDYGNLTYVIPPKANIAITTAILDELCYQYKYDYRNRLVEKKIPGKQWEFIVYDKLDRPIASGPALSPFTSPTGNGWLITKYDAFNRPVITAWMPATVTSAGRKTLQDARDAELTNFSETKIATTANTTINGVAFRYTNAVYPFSGYHVLSVNYYDDYNFPNAPTIPSAVEGQTVYYNTTVKPKGLPTGTWTRVLETSTLYKNEVAYTLYDYKARPIRSYINNYLGGYTYVDSKLDFTGKTEYTVTNHKLLGSSVELTTREDFVYSDQGRLLTQTHQINGGTKQLITKNDYDELGQLISKKVGGTDITGATGLQTIDYAYNVRGWLKQINDPNILGTDLFGFKINYNTASHGATPLYNGNISETEWKTQNDNVLRWYKYGYDKLNRITSGIDNTADTRYSLSSVAYDPNGNITNLTRRGHTNIGATTFGVMDQLTYTYQVNSNKLTIVSDVGNDTFGFKDDQIGTGTDTTVDYTYDTNGNLLSDANKGITSVVYNYLDMPTEIKFNNSNTQKINYTYSADGIKLRKVTNDNGNVSTTDYAGNYVYENNVLKQFNQPEGYVEPNGSSWQYVYRLTDIWGNTRITFADDNNNGSVNSSEIRREQNYYPGGLEHKGYNNSMYGVKNNLKTYQKQEFTEDLGLNVHEWKYRMSDPAILRFWQVDPLAEDYMYNSTYAFAENKLGMGIELEGAEIWTWAQQAAVVDAAVNPNGVGAHALGISQGLVNTVTGVIDAFSNPGQTLEGMGNMLVAGAANGNPATMLELDNVLGTNSFGTSAAMGQALDGTVNDVMNGNGIERGTVIGEVIGAVAGTKGTNVALKGTSTTLKTTKVATGTVSKSKNVGPITGHTKHGLNQSISRNNGRGVSAQGKLDAVKNPKSVTQQSGGRTKYKGKNATVILNEEGKVITTYGKPRGN